MKVFQQFLEWLYTGELCERRDSSSSKSGGRSDTEIERIGPHKEEGEKQQSEADPQTAFCSSRKFECCKGVRELMDLYCLGYEYHVRDLMWRCEEELVLKSHPTNVMCLLVNYFTRLKGHQVLPPLEDEDAEFLQRADGSPAGSQASPVLEEEAKSETRAVLNHH